MKIVSDEKDKPVLNEEILGRLLEAAYVLQEHNRAQQQVELNLERQSEQLREQEQAEEISARTKVVPGPSESASAVASAPKDFTSTLAQIVETQHQIQLRQLDLESALEMVLERLVEIAHGDGAAVAIVDGKVVRYAAGVGSSAPARGSKVEKERALCFDCLRTGQVTRCNDLGSDFLLDVNECRRRGIESLIAVPVYHAGGIAGALELYFAEANAFGEQEVHGCQLMAGLVTEALARDEEVTWKKSLAEERSAMLDALEKLKPNLAALVGDAALNALNAATAAGTPVATPEVYKCSDCGEQLVAGEQYCGKCGSPRAEEAPPVSLQTKLASAWTAQHSETPKSGDVTDPERAPDPLFPTSDPFSLSNTALTQTKPATHVPYAPWENIAEDEPPPDALAATAESATEIQDSESANPATPADASENDQTWTSAAKAKDFLEQVANAKKTPESAFARFWKARRGDTYLAVAVVLVALVVRWGLWSDHSVAATSSPTPATALTANAQNRPLEPEPEPELSLLDKMLINLGLADAPPTPQDKGNPETQVWIDLHTALYYCPGADLYGKTPKGRYTSQRDAQMDQFEPAYRKACQ